MLLWILRHALFLRKAIKSDSSPRQMAWGLVLGMLLGLLPKGNLLAIAVSMVICAVQIDLAVTMLAACAFSLLGMFLDPLTHRLGAVVLHADGLAGVWNELHDVPLLPWTAFNNTVVLGSLLLGLILAWPAYRLSFPRFQRYCTRRDEAAKAAALAAEGT